MTNKYIGNKQFYRQVSLVMIPILIQNAITNFVNMLDNIMVGQVGQIQMSSVSIVNQLFFIYNLVIFGTVNAAGIFSTQFFGKKDHDGMRKCLQIKIISTLAIALFGLFLFYFFSEGFISLYIDAANNSLNDIALAMQSAKDYLFIMLIGIIPFALTQSISSTIRDTGETRGPMYASTLAILTNFLFNYVLIFGHFGFPELGINGAAIATVIARFIEFIAILTIANHLKKRILCFNNILPFQYDPTLLRSILLRGTPLILNEFFWALGIAAINQCYSLYGLEAVASINIAETVNQLFIIISMSMGLTISILVGQKLGASDIKSAVDMDNKLIFLSFSLSLLFGLIMILTSFFFPQFYQVTNQVKETSRILILLYALLLPIQSLSNSSYFTLRSGGKTVLTFLFDSGFTCLISYPIAFILSRYFSFPLIYMFLMVKCADLFKALFGMILVEKKVWINTLV
ncbi:MAG: MATE family efflux transporter [Solobacterium sp.]|nr:MATE family efflux transporter [Solobacterium sp.]